MAPSELKHSVEQTGSVYFTRESMRFFGDTMKNYGVRSATVKTHSGEELESWELYRKRPVNNGNQQSAFFDKETFKRVLPAMNNSAKE